MTMPDDDTLRQLCAGSMASSVPSMRECRRTDLEMTGKPLGRQASVRDANALGSIGGPKAIKSLMVRRRSVREFNDRSIDASVPEHIMDMVQDNHDSLIDSPAILRVVFVSSAWRELSAGAYELRDGRLSQIATGEDIRVGEDDQIGLGSPLRWYAYPPLTLLFYVDLGIAQTHFGSRGYQFSLVAAGAACDAAWLAAISLGLSGCPFGGVDARLGRVCSPSRGRLVRVVLGLGLGYARGETEGGVV